jgi:hypothetical protein
MREEIAYQEMQQEMQQNPQGQQSVDPTMKPEPADLDAATRQADQCDAHRQSDPDRMPTANEEHAAEKAYMPAGAAKAYGEALERGAHQQGEGRIE